MNHVGPKMMPAGQTTRQGEPKPAAPKSEETVPEWRALGLELDSWATAGLKATFWWRDDDAAVIDPALTLMLQISARTEVSVALSVVPATATEQLATYLENWPLAAILQHGFEHVNHAPEGAKKTELASNRPLAAMLTDVEKGAERLRGLFGARALPVLVPPWNRISTGLAAALPKLGFVGLSAFRGRPVAPPGLIEVNTHVDLINWRGRRTFVGERVALDATINHLRSRRLGSENQGEPTGILTHHLVMDDQAMAFLERFLTVTKAHRAVEWLSAETIFRKPV